MKTSLRSFTVAVAISSLFVPNIVSAGEKVMRTSDVEITHDFAKRVAKGHHDTCRAMVGLGIDYPVLVQRALDGESRAIRLMLSIGQVARFDGVVAESYAATRYKVAMLVGDEKLVAACRDFKEGVDHAAIREAFLGWPNPGEDSAGAETEMRRRLPMFWQLMTESVEQGEARRPATAADAKSEGSENPNPEAERRSP